jgi:light-regulated signal transduction histidine kinase (bacteriophytochrome)
MSGFAQLLREGYETQLDESARHYLERISAAATEMGSLIDALLRLSRVQRVPLHLEPIDMAALATSVWAEVPGARSCAMTMDELPPATGDMQLIQHVWVNLLDNAVKFSSRSKDPQVRIDAWQDGGTNVYRIRDNGAGFDPECAPSLFQPFSRLGAADDYPGTGLGLALVHRIVARHGGRVWAECSPEDGTSFCFAVGAVS